MGLKSALGRLKKIAEHVDAPTTKIDDWVWRPLSDFHRDTGYIEEVPAYIQDNFGRFMQEQAERARRGEMGPRDLLKAYGITRSSVMRTGRKLDDVERLGLKIYDPEPGLIRPEGAFSSWLLSPAGQKYLDLAEQGVADTDSIEDIRRKFRVFGMQNMLADDLRYAAENLAPKGYELNEMLFAPIDEWRGFTEGIKGVSSGKSGFPASMLGRGDIGTFDAREIKGHTGMSSEDAGKYMSRSRQGRPIGGYEAVDRMGDRQRAMDVRIEPDLEPYYQHLVHHGNWDALEGDQTTHNDLIRALRHAAVVAPLAGGAALYRPESEEPGMAKGGLVGLAEKYLPRMMSIFSGGGTLEHGLEGLVKPVMAIEKDPNIARHYAKAHGENILNADVRDVDFKPMAGEVDYLHASPSCKNYSSASCKTEDPIDLMTAEATARAIRDIRPPLFTLENVPAYQKREAFQRIADELNNQGYNWDVVQHNAADLGAPSSRNRMMVRASLGDLPPAQQYWPKPGDWFPAIEDQLESMRPSQLAPWQLMRLAERGIDPASLDTPLLVGGGSGFKGDIPLAFAGKPGITVLSSPVQTDRVVLPGGDVRALNPRSYARLLGLSDSYPLPDDRNLAKIIVGNGMAPAMTREVVEPLLNQRLINMVEKYK